MKFELEMSHIVLSPDASAKKREAMRSFEEHFKGMWQHEMGKARKQVADAFIKLVHPDRIGLVEEQIAALQSVKNPAKFRTEVILLLADAFQGGLAWGVNLSEEATEKGVKVGDLIGQK